MSSKKDLATARPYKEIGLVGGWFASDGDNYHKMHMATSAKPRRSVRQLEFSIPE
jgi:hypothetical protein